MNNFFFHMVLIVWEWPNSDTCLSVFVFGIIIIFHLANNVFRLFVLIKDLLLL